MIKISKTNGILYYRGNDKELRERSDWNELSRDVKKQLGLKVKRFGKLEWFETESLYPPDKYWVGEIENGVPHGQGTFYIPESYNPVLEFYNGSKFVGTYVNGERQEGTFTWSRGNKYIGSYKNNKRWNGTMHYKEDGEIITYANGENFTKIENIENYKKY
ncbi:uncharacterized protein METZ01_LOCUS356854, partial [marine metagenome]